jgi:hypothetical protein
VLSAGVSVVVEPFPFAFLPLLLKLTAALLFGFAQLLRHFLLLSPADFSTGLHAVVVVIIIGPSHSADTAKHQDRTLSFRVHAHDNST